MPGQFAQAKNYQLQLAQYQLAVGTVLRDVKKVFNDLGLSAERLAIASLEKRKIQQLTEQSDAVIEQV